MIYLDNAATTRVDDRVLDAMLPYLKENFGNSQSQHHYGRVAANALLSSRDKIAGILDCRSEEVYFVSGGTEAGNTALKGVCLAHGSGHLVISAIEHPSVIESAKQMSKLGFGVTFVKPDECGVVNPCDVASAIRSDTIFCAVMAANNETGVIQPIKEIGEICRDRGVFYFADCVQSAGTQPVCTEFCDGLSISSHKLYGPKGAAALYIRGGSKVSGIISGGMQERGLRGGTVNVAAVVGFAEAFKASVEDRERSKKIGEIRDRFLKRVFSEIEGVHINGSGNVLPSHANLSFDGCEGENILFGLDLNGVAVSTGSACSAGAVSPSHVLEAMGLSKERVASAVRFAFGKDNTLEDADRAADILKKVIEKIRR